MDLRSYLEAKGLTPEAFARLAGVYNSTIHRLLSGESRPQLGTIEKIARATRGRVTARDWIDARPA